MTKFSDRYLRGIKATGKWLELRDDKEPGLSLRVSPAGAKAWSTRYKDAGGKHRRKTIGAFPGVGLAEARNRTRKLRVGIADGGNPVVEERAAKRIEKENLGRTVETVGLAYFAAAQKGRHKPKGRPRAASTTRIDRGYFNREVLPAIGDVPVVEVSRELVQDHVDRLADTATVSAARGFLKVTRQILAFAEYRGLVTGNVCRFVEASDYDGRDRVLSDDELRAIWNAADISNALGFGQAFAIVVKLCMASGQRRAEVAEATLDEFDLEQRTWLIPAERRKTNRAHMVPLSDMAVDLIRDAIALRRNSNSAFLFPSPRGAVDAPISSNVATRCFSGLAEHAGIENARLHDLRRSCATSLTSERIGVPRHTVSQVLGHQDSAGGAAATATYDRHSYLPQKRQALDAWAALLTEIVNGTPHP